MFKLGKRTRGAVVAGGAILAMLIAFVYVGGWGPGVSAAATKPALGLADSFAVFAAAGITNVGATVVTGDLGTDPTPAVTGFFGTTANDGPGTVVGAIHQKNATSLAARGALNAAYLGAAAQVPDFTVATELGAQTLAPGVYNSASGTFGITGTLTLNGGANDIWVFKTTSTLITAASSVVSLTGAAQACNVFWQVGSSATLGASSTLRGTIMADTTITVGSSATVDGRLLAGAVKDSGALTFAGLGSTVTKPTCAVPVPPTLAKGFLPISITEGGTSTLTIVLSNPNLTAATLTAPLVDTLPVGVVIAAIPAAVPGCGSVVTAVSGATTVTLTGGAIPAGIIGTPGTCTVKVNVTAPVAGSYINTLPAGSLQTSNGNNAAPVSATLTVVPPVGPPTLAKGFLPISITEGGTSTLTIVLSNPNLTAATLTAPLVDTLPVGVVIAAIPAAVPGCGSVVTAVSGATTVTLTGGAIPAGIIGTPGTCTVKVNVTAPVAGSYINTLPAGSLQTSNGNNAAPVSATLTVVQPPAAPTLGKGFIPFSINQGSVSTLTITLSNPNLTAATLTAALIDTLPAGVVIAATPNAGTTCSGAGAVVAAAGGATVTLPATRSIPAGIIGTPGACTVTVDVTAPLAGSYINTLPAGSLQTSNGNNAAPVSATLTVVQPPAAPRPGSGGGGGGGSVPPTPTPTVTPAYVFLSSALCLVEVCPYGQQYLQAGQQMYATFSLNKVPADLVRAEAYLNGVKYKDISWPGPYTSAGPFTTATVLGLAPGAGIVELRVWVGNTYIGAFSTTVVNPFVKGTCPGSGTNCPQVVGPPSGVKLSTLGTTLLWENPPGTTQVQVRVTPANDDGPGINLILGSPATSFTVQEAIFGAGNYIMLPGMTYTWQARVTSQATPAKETDGSWGPWSDPQTFQTRTTSSDGISLLSPTGSGSVATLTPTVRWSNSDTGVFYYEVQLSADPAFNTDAATAITSVYWNLVHGGMSSPANSWTVPADFALEAGATYHWRVRPRIQGDGVPVPWSEASSFRTR